MSGAPGWIVLSRKLFETDPDWSEPRIFSRFEAWIDVIQMTAFADHKKVVGGQIVELKRGEVLLSVRFLARRWGWSNGRITRWLKTGTATEHLRVQRRTADGNIYLLPKYDTYQSPWNANGYGNGTGDETKRVQQRNTDGYKDKEGKEGKEEETPLPPAAAPPLPANARVRHLEGVVKKKRGKREFPSCTEAEREAWQIYLTARLAGFQALGQGGNGAPLLSEGNLALLRTALAKLRADFSDPEERFRDAMAELPRDAYSLGQAPGWPGARLDPREVFKINGKVFPLEKLSNAHRARGENSGLSDFDRQRTTPGFVDTFENFWLYEGRPGSEDEYRAELAARGYAPDAIDDAIRAAMADRQARKMQPTSPQLTLLAGAAH